MNPMISIARPGKWFVLLTIAVLPLLCGSCELIPLATLATVFGIAGTAATTAPVVYQQGKLDTVFMADYAEVRAAVQLAARDLRLRIVRSRPASKHEPIWDYKLEDDMKSKLEITVERRSANLCRCRIDVGLFGSEPTARLIMSRISAHLPTEATLAPLVTLRAPASRAAATRPTTGPK